MPLLDHFHPPLHGPRRWEGFHHSWATLIASQLNQAPLPANYYAEPEITIGPELETDGATLQESPVADVTAGSESHPYVPPRPEMSAKVDFSRLDGIEIRVYQDLGGAELRAAIELVSPANKDRPASRQTFAAKCSSYLRHGIGVVIVDVVTARSANLHQEVFDLLAAKGRRLAWDPPTGLYAVAYRAVTVRNAPRVEVWPEVLTLGQPLPTLPLWLALDLCVPLRLEESYVATCRSLRIPA
jgi:Protein of unknown function (DUF4058)